MATLDQRQLYIDTFLDEILKTASTTENSMSDTSRQMIYETLRDTFTQSLCAVEERFGNYTEQLRSLDDDINQIMKAKKIILSTETVKAKMITAKDVPKPSPSKQLHREALKNCTKLLRDTIDLQTSNILDELVAKDVLSVSDEESVKGHGNRKRQNDELLGYLVGLTAESFHNVLLPVLSTEYPHVVEALINELDRLEAEYEEKLCVSCRVRRDVQVKRIATALLTKKSITYAMYLDLKSTGLSNTAKWVELKSLPDIAVIDAMERRYPDLYKDLKALDHPSLKCRCVEDNGVEGSDDETTTRADDDSDNSLCQIDEMISKIEVLSSLNETETAYKMNAHPRGICLIINNTEIKGRIKRSWSQKDQVKLQRVFTKLDFLVETRVDLSANMMITTALEFAEANHSRFDAFVCCILTYGNEEGLFGYDGNSLQESDLTSPFQASSCPSLAGKPKMFFIQANRLDNSQYQKIKTTDNTDDADFLLGYCTSPLSLSFVNSSGSVYISALTQILDKYSDRHDLLTIMRMVNQEMSKQTIVNYFGHCYGQVPAPVFTLTKDVFLTSNPCWSPVPMEEEMDEFTVSA